MLSRQFPGTEKHPQGRLFKPEYTGDPHKLSPENWMSQDASKGINRWTDGLNRMQGDQQPPDRQGGDVLTFHTNTTGKLPTRDIAFRTKPKSRDSKGRAIGEDGSLVGMHYGTVKAGLDRIHNWDDPAPAVAHAVKFDASKQFGRYDHPSTVNDPGNTREVNAWSDEDANLNESVTDMVEAGHVIPYRNDVEDAGSVSYRALPQTMRTWSQDVKAAPKSGPGAPHPAYQHLAERGYNPVVETGKIYEATYYQPRQLPLTETDHNERLMLARMGGPIDPLRGESVDPFSQRNIDEYNKETTRIQQEARGVGPQFSQWTMKKNV